MFQPVAIAPSILSADFMNLGRDIRMIEQAGAGYVHVDVMDGHFVPNLTMGVPVVKQLAKLANIPLDVHLMIDNPLDELPWFLEAGADIACVHAEVLYGDELRRAVDMIHDAGAKAAVALKPHTPPEVLEEVIARLDMVLVMSVEPGFGGQKFMDGALGKIAQLRRTIDEAGLSTLIEVDGGISAHNARLLFDTGADVLVAGNAVFGADDPKAEIERMLDV